MKRRRERGDDCVILPVAAQPWGMPSHLQSLTLLALVAFRSNLKTRLSEVHQVIHFGREWTAIACDALKQ